MSLSKIANNRCYCTCISVEILVNDCVIFGYLICTSKLYKLIWQFTIIRPELRAWIIFHRNVVYAQTWVENDLRWFEFGFSTKRDRMSARNTLCPLVYCWTKVHSSSSPTTQSQYFVPLENLIKYLTHTKYELFAFTRSILSSDFWCSINLPFSLFNL